MENKTNIIITSLTIIIIILSTLCVLFATNIIDLQKNEINNNNFDKNNISENEDDKINKEPSLNNNQQIENETTKTIENYLGNWYLYENNDYTYINIEKSTTSSTNYVIDIRVNKMADYNDLELHCTDGDVICHFYGDENQNFILVMAYNKIVIIPDYAPFGTSWTFAIKE